MLDSMNNHILWWLEQRSMRLAGVYWRIIGKHVPINW